MLVLLMDSSCAPSDSNDNAASAAASAVASASVGASATGRGGGGEDIGEDDTEIDGLTPRIQHAWSLSSELEYRPERRIRQEKVVSVRGE